MNLITQAIENIYKYGNSILYFGKYNSRVIFETGDNNKLKIRIENEYNDEDLCQESELTPEEGLSYIVYLVYYSIFESKRKKDMVYISYDPDYKESCNGNSLNAINELYQQLLPMLSTDSRYIELLAKECNDTHMIYDCMVNSAKYVDSNGYNMVNVKDIMKSIIEKFLVFNDSLQKAIMLWENIGESNSKEEFYVALNEWQEFINKLYIQGLDDSTKIDLNSLNISYEFLTNKNYLANPAIGCDKEIEKLEIALLTPSKQAILVGPPGVGKTAVVEGLAYLISRNQVPKALQNKKILKVNTSSIVKGCNLVGMFEDKVEKLMQYLMENPDTILFIDEMHTAIGAGLGSIGNLDLANIMKPYIDRGQIKIIGATTDEEYEEYIKSDNAFNRRFQKIKVSEPEEKVLCEIINGTIDKLKKITNIDWNFEDEISEIIIKHIATSTQSINRVYNDKRYNPDLSLTILETAFAIAMLTNQQCVSVECIAESIRNNENLYESTRTRDAEDLLKKCQASRPVKSKIIEFPTFKA